MTTPFKQFCRDVFATLSRIDQRQAAETYLYGLLNCSGRKSIRRLVATAPGRSEQSLQQFINQSPWDAGPIRQRLLGQLSRVLPPTAWIIEEVHFPKHGHYSAAVERQYVRSLGRVCNCQLAIAVTLTSGRYTIPVNWRLLIPDSWGRDAERRARARIPDEELPRPYWQYHLEVLDDMALEWGMQPAPVLADTTHRGHVDAFLGGLELRRIPYLVQVGPSLGVCYEPPTRQLRPVPAAAGAGSVAAWRGTVTELTRKTANLPRETVEWRTEVHHGLLRSQFYQLPVRGLVPENGSGARSAPSAPRLLITDWPLGLARPRAFWITNMVDRPLPELVHLAKTRDLSASRIEDFAGRYGLRDYEGRTFIGWHHHVTLAGAAYTYDIVSKLADETVGARGESSELEAEMSPAAAG